MEGTLIADRYRVDALIGEGGMALVYRGTDTTLDRRVAIKILRPALSEQHDVVARFRREAHAAAKLNHPNIVQIYDTGVDDGKYYIVMEYLPEMNLKEVIKRYAPLPLDKVVEVAMACCEGLAHAHRQGIVHRDIKPHNVLFTDDGRAELSDFGIAAAAGEAGLTEDGKVLGSAHYISPEQAQGAAAGPLSDIYSLGVTLYEAMTGRLPFDGETAADIAAQHLREAPPSPRSINPDIPPAAEFIIQKAMARDPQRRYRSADEMLADIRKLERGLDLDQTGVLPPTPPDATVALPRAPESARRPQSAYEEPPAVSQPVRPVSAGAGARRDRPGSSANAALAGVGVGLLAVLVIVAVVYLVRVAFYRDATPAMIEVPNVKGLTEQQARDGIEERGLVVGRVEQQFSDLLPQGEVTEQQPAPGQMVQSGSSVDLVVNLGKETVSVIDVVGTRVERAQALLEADGLTLGQVTEYFHETEPAGIIFEQDPRPGTRVDKGTGIDVSVSKGPEEAAPTEEPTEPAPDETVENGGETPEEQPQAADPRVFVDQVGEAEASGVRKFQVRVIATGEVPDQKIDVRYRDESGYERHEEFSLQPGDSRMVEIRTEGTVTITVYHQDGVVFENTYQLEQGEPAAP